MSEEKKFYIRDIVRICEDRGWKPEHIQQFLNLWNDMPYGYTISMVDQYEWSLNGPVMVYLHPDSAYIGCRYDDED